MARPPVRPTEAPMRLPVSGIYKIKGVGDVVAGRVEQGVVKPGEEAPDWTEGVVVRSWMRRRAYLRRSLVVLL